jgi:hypothetical protein
MRILAMHRLLLLPMSVAMLMLLVGSSAAQTATSPKTGSLNVGGQASGSAAQPAAPAGSLSVGAGAAPKAGAATTPPTAASKLTPAAATTPPPTAAGVPAAAAPDQTTPGAATSPAAAASTTTNTAVKDEPIDAGTYGVRLRDLEQRINELKEQVFRSKARLSLLAETVLQGVVAGSQARLVHENKMGNSYKLVKVVYALDGAPIFNKADEEGSLGDAEEFDIYNGSIVPGEHTLSVKLEYRGHGYGIFSYLKGYRFKVNSSHTFTAPEAKSLTLRVVGYEKGGPATPLEERPAVRYVERVAGIAPPAPEAQAGAGGG